MKITILGTATSQGLPVIGCVCPVCVSDDPRDKRLRTAALIEVDGLNIVIDIGPDFRQQMLRAKVQDIDAILVTHEHNDHIIGLDDVRPLNFKHQKDIPIYARPSVGADLKERFAYVFQENPYPGAPRIDIRPIKSKQAFFIKNTVIYPIETIHGSLPIYGFRIGDFTYLTDAKYMEKEELEKINGSKVLVLSALHHWEHHAHLSLSEALRLIEKIEVEKVYLTHLSHRMGTTESVEKLLPSNVRVAYDGQVIQL